MNIYDEASKLAGKIRESKEYKEYKKLKENIESNPIKKSTSRRIWTLKI